MSTTITGKLNKPANKFQAGDYTGFGVRLGVQYYDRKTKQKEWTNYSAVIFASQPAKIKYYEDVLIEGAVIELTGQNQRIDSYEGSNGVSLSIELLEASLGYVFANNVATPDNQPSSLQQQSQVNQNTGTQGSDPGEFDDELPPF